MIASTSFYFALTPEQTFQPMGSISNLTSLSSFRLPKSKSFKRGLEKLVSIPSSLSRSSSFSKKNKKAEFEFTFVSNECSHFEQDDQTTSTSTKSETGSTLVDLDQKTTSSDVFSMIKTPREDEWLSSPLSPLTKGFPTTNQLNKARRRVRLSREQYIDSRQENNCLKNKDNFQIDQSLQDTLNTSVSCDISSSEDEHSLVTQRIKARLAEARLKASQTHRAYLAVREDTSILDDQKLSQAVSTWLDSPKQPTQIIVTV